MSACCSCSSQQRGTTEVVIFFFVFPICPLSLKRSESQVVMESRDAIDSARFDELETEKDQSFLKGMCAMSYYDNQLLTKQF